MNFISPIIRVVVGLVLIVVSISRYFSIRAQIAEADGGEIEVFGRVTTAEPWQLMLIFGLGGLFGLALIGLGAYSLLKKLQEG